MMSENSDENLTNNILYDIKSSPKRSLTRTPTPDAFSGDFEPCTANSLVTVDFGSRSTDKKVGQKDNSSFEISGTGLHLFNSFTSTPNTTVSDVVTVEVEGEEQSEDVISDSHENYGNIQDVSAEENDEERY